VPRTASAALVTGSVGGDVPREQLDESVGEEDGALTALLPRPDLQSVRVRALVAGRRQEEPQHRGRACQRPRLRPAIDTRGVSGPPETLTYVSGRTIGRTRSS
jgi:hypothetical protein